MSSSVLTFGGETWRMRKPGDLSFRLWHSSLDLEAVRYEMSIPLVPASVVGDDWTCDGTAHAYLESWGEMYLRRDLRNLEGLTLKHTPEAADSEDGTSSYQEEPGLSLQLQRPGQADYEPLTKEFPWSPTLRFGKRDQSEWLYTFEVSAFFPTTAYREAFDAAAIRQYHRESGRGADLPPECEFLDPPEEGCAEIDWEGWVWLDKIVCYVPGNSPNPIAYAKRMVKDALNHDSFGIQYVNGSNDSYFGEFDPTDGMCATGDRCVVLCPETPRDAARREELRQRRAR